MECLAKNPANRPSAADLIATLPLQRQFVPREETVMGTNVNRANTLAELGRTEEAEAILKQCLAENPLYLPALIAAAEIAGMNKNFKGAAEMAEKAAAVASWSSAPPPELKTLYVNLSFYYLMIDPEQTIRYAREALKLDSGDWQAQGNLAEGCRLLARKSPLRKKSLLDEALAAILEALRAAPDQLNLILSHGQILVAKGDIEALRLFLKTTRFPPSAETQHGVNPNVGSLIVSIYIALGQFDKAEELLRPAREHPELKVLVQIAEQEMALRRREIARIGIPEFDGCAVWVVKGSRPEKFVIAFANQKRAGDKIYKKTDPLPEAQTRTMLKLMGLSELLIEQELQQARQHPNPP